MTRFNTYEHHVLRFREVTRDQPRDRVLELGPFEGKITYDLCEIYKEVVAIEYRSENIRRTEKGLREGGRTNWRIVQGDVTQFDYSQLGTFDLVYNSGVLYHVPEPWNLLSSLNAVAPVMWVCTHIVREGSENLQGYDGGWWNEHGGLADLMGGLSPKSFWPTQASLHKMFMDTGWGDFTQVGDYPDCDNGWRVQYLCKN